MGVDIYVGTLTRYFARDWKTIVQQTVPAGIRYSGKNAAPPADADEQANIQRVVLDWRSQIQQMTAGAITDDWNWDESVGLPYWTDKPGWWGHNALRAIALDPKQDRRAGLKKIPQHAPGEWGGLKTEQTKAFRHVVWRSGGCRSGSTVSPASVLPAEPKSSWARSTRSWLSSKHSTA